MTRPQVGSTTTDSHRPLLRRPGVVLVLVLAAVALLAERRLLGSGALSGGRLLPAPPGARDLWDAYLAPDGEPRLALLAVLSTALLGRAGLAVDLLLLLSVPLSAASTWAATRNLVRPPLLRAWTAATWALLPVATGGLAAGRLDVAVVQIALPGLLVAAGQVLRGDPRHGWRSAAGLALGLTAVSAFAPQLWPLAAVLLLGAAVLALAATPPGWRSVAVRRLLASAAAVAAPVVVLLPGTWLPGLDPLLRGPGLPRPDLASADLPAWHLLLLAPGGPRLPPLVVGGGLLLASLAGLLVPGRPRLAVVGWAVGLSGLAYALVLARTDAAAGPVWPGVGLQVAGAGLLLSAVAGADGLGTRLQQVSFGWRQVAAVVVVVAAALVPVLSAASWVARGADGPLERGDVEVLPAFVRADLTSSGGRSLVLRPRADGTVAYALAGAGGARLGDAPPSTDGEDTAALDATVADLMTARGSGAAADLAARGVRWVAFDRPVTGPAPGAVLPLDPPPLYPPPLDPPPLDPPPLGPLPLDARTADPLVRGLDAQRGLVREAGGPPLLWRVVASPSTSTAVAARGTGVDVARAAWQVLGLLALTAATLLGPHRPAGSR